MPDTTIDLEKMTEAMLTSFAGLSALVGTDEMKVGLEGARQLATTGQPTTAAHIAAALGLPEKRVEDLLDTFADTGFAFRDEDGSVLAMCCLTVPGTAVPGTPHRVTIKARGGPTVYAWCALDTLYLSYMFDVPVRVWSICPITRRSISCIIKPDGTVLGATPSEAVLSVLIPHGPITKDVRSSFCHYVTFFADEETGRAWADKQTVTITFLGLAEAAVWTKQHYERLFCPSP